MIGVGGVKIVDAACKSLIDDLPGFFPVDLVGVSRDGGEAETAKAESGDLISPELFVIHKNPPFKACLLTL